MEDVNLAWAIVEHVVKSGRTITFSPADGVKAFAKDGTPLEYINIQIRDRSGKGSTNALPVLSLKGDQLDNKNLAGFLKNFAGG